MFYESLKTNVGRKTRVVTSKLSDVASQIDFSFGKSAADFIDGTANDSNNTEINVRGGPVNKEAVSLAPVLEARNLNVYYGEKQALTDVSVQIDRHKVVAIIGPSGCGKSTLLRSFNRMNDFTPTMRIDGEILFNSKNIFERKIDAAQIRRQVGMVFQRPNPFPKSIRANVTWGPKINGFQGDMNELVETSLKRAALWDEVKDRLEDSALALSGGQQQRLCIARAIAMEPSVILMDEPCSALDPLATDRIETLIGELQDRYTIVIVTHNMQQAARVSDEILFFFNGELIEAGETGQIFTNPKVKKTQDYITGRFG